MTKPFFKSYSCSGFHRLNLSQQVYTNTFSSPMLDCYPRRDLIKGTESRKEKNRHTLYSLTYTAQRSSGWIMQLAYMHISNVGVRKPGAAVFLCASVSKQTGSAFRSRA
jgi:hypothetical protein